MKGRRKEDKDSDVSCGSHVAISYFGQDGDHRCEKVRSRWFLGNRGQDLGGEGEL